MSVRAVWSEVHFKASVSLLIFCVDDLPVAETATQIPPLLLYFCLSLPSVLLVFD